MPLRVTALTAALAVAAALLWTNAPTKRGQSGARLAPRDSATPVPVLASAAAERSKSAAKPSLGSVGFPSDVQPLSEVISWRDLDEDEIMSELSELGAADPALSLQLAHEAEARFRDSPRAVERAYFEVRALVNAGQVAKAVARARDLVAANPDHPLANEVARHLLTHPLTHPTEVAARPAH